jgi:hypothetical protein
MGPKNGARGPKKGAKYAKTLRKQAELEALIQLVKKDLVPMTEAQIELAKGIGYMVIRQSDGTFARATDEKAIDIALTTGEEGKTYRFFTQQPNTQAFADLMNRTFGKPTERHEHTGEDGGPIEVKWKG